LLRYRLLGVFEVAPFPLPVFDFTPFAGFCDSSRRDFTVESEISDISSCTTDFRNAASRATVARVGIFATNSGVNIALGAVVMARNSSLAV
jgi:hypothetical protein